MAPHDIDIFQDCDELLYCLSSWSNTVTFDSFWTWILLGFCVVLLIATFRWGAPRAFGFASVSGVFGALFLVTMELIPWWIATIFFLTGAFGIVAMIVSER